MERRNCEDGAVRVPADFVWCMTSKTGQVHGKTAKCVVLIFLSLHLSTVEAQLEDCKVPNRRYFSESCRSPRRRELSPPELQRYSLSYSATRGNHPLLVRFIRTNVSYVKTRQAFLHPPVPFARSLLWCRGGAYQLGRDVPVRVFAGVFLVSTSA